MEAKEGGEVWVLSSIARILSFPGLLPSKYVVIAQQMPTNWRELPVNALSEKNNEAQILSADPADKPDSRMEAIASSSLLSLLHAE